MGATVAMIMEEVLISIIMITATTEEVAIMEDHATEVVEAEVVEAEEVVEGGTEEGAMEEVMGEEMGADVEVTEGDAGAMGEAVAVGGAEEDVEAEIDLFMSYF